MAHLTRRKKEKKQFKVKNKTAKCLITQYVDDNPLGYIRDKFQAHEIWKALQEIYEKKGLSGQMALRRQLIALKLAEGEALEPFLRWSTSLLIGDNADTCKCSCGIASTRDPQGE